MRKILADGPDRPVMWVNVKGKNQSAEFTVPIGGKSFRGQIEGATGVVIEPGPLQPFASMFNTGGVVVEQ
jgi:hypothetical protein